MTARAAASSALGVTSRVPACQSAEAGSRPGGMFGDIPEAPANPLKV